MKTTTLIALLILSTQQAAYANSDNIKEERSFDEHRRHGEGDRARGLPPQMKEEISEVLRQEELLGDLWKSEYLENNEVIALIEESLHKKKPEHIEGQRPDMSEALKSSLSNEELLEELKVTISNIDKSSVSAVISCSKKEQEEKKDIVPESATKLQQEVEKVKEVIAKTKESEREEEFKKERKESKHKVADSDLSRPSSEFHERPGHKEQDDTGRPFKEAKGQESNQEYAQVDINTIKLELIMSLLKDTSLFNNQGQMQTQAQMQGAGQSQIPQMSFQVQGFGQFNANTQQQPQYMGSMGSMGSMGYMGNMGNMGTPRMMSNFTQQNRIMPQQQGAQVFSQDYGIFNMNMPSQNTQVNNFNNLNQQQNFGIMF